MPTDGPDDLGPLDALEIAGLAPEHVIAMVAKSEGNGCVNDFSRTLATHAWERVLPDTAITIVSGGTEGVLSPHVTLLAQGPENARLPAGGLLANVGRTEAIPPYEIGRPAHIDAVADTVRELVGAVGVDTAAVQLALVKTPLLTFEKVTACAAAGMPPVTTDPYESMARSRRAAALGVAVALGECSREQAEESIEYGAAAFSSVASVSAGGELDDCHVVLLARGDDDGPLRALHTVMADALDMASVAELLGAVEAEGGRLIQVFAKAEADPTGRIRGRRHTMLTDSDIHSTRHARAAVGGLLVAMVGDGCLYVSAGAEAQGPPGGGPVTVVYEVGGR